MNYGKPNKEKFNEETKLIPENTGSKEEKSKEMENQYVAEGWRYHWDSDIEFNKFETGVEKVDNYIKSIMENIPFIDIKPYSHNIINLNLELLSRMDKEISLDIIERTPLIDMGWGWIVRKERNKNRTELISMEQLEKLSPEELEKLKQSEEFKKKRLSLI